MSESREQLLALDILSIVYSLLIILVVHYGFMLISFLYCKLTKADLPAEKAFVLTCSMKTLPIAMTSMIHCFIVDL